MKNLFGCCGVFSGWDDFEIKVGLRNEKSLPIVEKHIQAKDDDERSYAD
jgi:hypothetical protein